VTVYVPGLENVSEKIEPEPVTPLESVQEYVGVLLLASRVPPVAVSVAGIVLVGVTRVELPTVLVADVAKMV
jgi:hypothetical protein